ncbi:hypothetical protein HDV00_006960, partial [Rhizophlyctis rosea]
MDLPVHGEPGCEAIVNNFSTEDEKLVARAISKLNKKQLERRPKGKTYRLYPYALQTAKREVANSKTRFFLTKCLMNAKGRVPVSSGETPSNVDVIYTKKGKRNREVAPQLERPNLARRARKDEQSNSSDDDLPLEPPTKQFCPHNVDAWLQTIEGVTQDSGLPTDSRHEEELTLEAIRSVQHAALNEYRQRQCLPLYAVLLPAHPAGPVAVSHVSIPPPSTQRPSSVPGMHISPRPRYVVDLQVGLFLGYSSGQAVLDRYPHLLRRLATTAEKAQLETRPLAESVYLCMTYNKDENAKQLIEYVDTPGGGRGLRVSELDIHLLREDEVLREVGLRDIGHMPFVEDVRVEEEKVEVCGEGE